MPPPSSLVGRSTRATLGIRGEPEESEESRLSFEELFELFRKRVEYSLENRKSHYVQALIKICTHSDNTGT